MFWEFDFLFKNHFLTLLQNSSEKFHAAKPVDFSLYFLFWRDQRMSHGGFRFWSGQTQGCSENTPGSISEVYIDREKSRLGGLYPEESEVFGLSAKTRPP